MDREDGSDVRVDEVSGEREVEEDDRLGDLRALAGRTEGALARAARQPTTIFVPASVRVAMRDAHVLDARSPPRPVWPHVRRVLEGLVLGVVIGGAGVAALLNVAPVPEAASARRVARASGDAAPARPVAVPDAVGEVVAEDPAPTPTSIVPGRAPDPDPDPVATPRKHRTVASSGARAPTRARASSSPSASSPSSASSPTAPPPVAAEAPPAEPAPTAADPGGLARAMAEAVGAPPPASPGAGDPPDRAPTFDRGAALAALARAATAAGACATTPSDAGRAGVTVTFGPSGAAEAVALDGALAGGAAAACVERAFRGARVPAFAGAPVRVHRSFVIP